MRDGKLQVGIVGVGGIARDQHLPAWANVPFAEVTAAADVAEAALNQVADSFAIRRRFVDWLPLVELDDLDIIDICTPNRTHTSIALAALAAGKHVLCEKPLATTTSEVQHLAGAASKAGKLLMTAQHWRFEPAAVQLKALIDAGTIGDIYYARAQFLRRRLVPGRPTFIEKQHSGGGPVFDIGVHILDLALWFMGSPSPVSVSAIVDAKLAHRPDLGGGWGDWDRQRFDVEDFAAGFVRFADGPALTLETSWLAFQQERELIRLQAFGTKAGFTWPDKTVVGETNRVPWSMRLDDVTEVSPYQAEIQQFACAARDGLPSPVPPEQSLKVIKILEGFYQSARQRREVTID